MDTRLSLSEVEAKARQMIQKACPSDMMDVITLKADRESGFVFVVLKCRAVSPDKSGLCPHPDK